MSKKSKLFTTTVTVCLLIGLSCGTISALAQNAGLYLFMIQTETADSIEKLRASQSWSVKLYVDNPSALKDSLRIDGIKVLSSTTEYTELVIEDNADRYKGSNAALTDATFVIDYDEPAVLILAEQLRSELQRAPTVAELTQFVDSTIKDKTYARGFEIASQVAEHKSGDCTEHAVLLTALARYFQMPARVTFGLLLYEEGNKLSTAGHAWSEVFYNNKWVRADATQLSSPQVENLKYIPLMPLVNEGPGYGANMYTLTTIIPSKVTDIKPFNG